MKRKYGTMLLTRHGPCLETSSAPLATYDKDSAGLKSSRTPVIEASFPSSLVSSSYVARGCSIMSK